MPVLRLCGGSVSMRSLAEQDAAGIELAKPRHHAQQRGLAAAGRPKQREELAVAHRDRHVIDGTHGTEGTGYTLDSDRGHAWLPVSACGG